MENAKSIVKTVEIRPGKRIIIEQESAGNTVYGYRIRTQEHRSIIGQYVRTDSDGWRDCVVSFETRFENACAEAYRSFRSYRV